MPGIQEIQLPERGEMGVAVEGSELSWPGAPGQPTAARAQPVRRRVAQRRQSSTAAVKPFRSRSRPRRRGWRLDLREGDVGPDRARAASARAGPTSRWARTTASLTVTGSDGTNVVVKVPVVNRRRPGDSRRVRGDERLRRDRGRAPRPRARAEGARVEDDPRPRPHALGRHALAGHRDAPRSQSGMRLEYRVHLFREGSGRRGRRIWRRRRSSSRGPASASPSRSTTSRRRS